MTLNVGIAGYGIVGKRRKLCVDLHPDMKIKAICDNIRKGTPHKPWHIEGYEKLSWVLLDYVDAIVHVFGTQERGYYNIEKLWADAPKKEYNY